MEHRHECVATAGRTASMPVGNCSQRLMDTARTFWYLFRGAIPLECGTLQHMLQHRIAVVFPWIQCLRNCGGMDTQAQALPPTLRLWLASAARNSEIADFLIIHDALSRPMFDAVLPTVLPTNVRRIQIESVGSLYQQRLNWTEPINAWSVARLKPTIGHVFAEHLASYTHWAYGDLDVVYGSLQRFLTPQLLQEHAIVTVLDEGLCMRHTRTWLAGQLTIFQNAIWVNNLFRTAPGSNSSVHVHKRFSGRFDWQAMTLKSAHYDERGSFPTVAAEVSSGRRLPIAYLAGQLSDLSGLQHMLGESCASPWAPCARLVWFDGRLLLVDNVRQSPSNEFLPGACIRSEAAMVHLGLVKFNDSRQCRSYCRATATGRGAWAWNSTINASMDAEIRTPGQVLRTSKTNRFTFGFMDAVGIRVLSKPLAQLIRNAEPNCFKWDRERSKMKLRATQLPFGSSLCPREKPCTAKMDCVCVNPS